MAEIRNTKRIWVGKPVSKLPYKRKRSVDDI
jgi:hypothetical protein